MKWTLFRSSSITFLSAEAEVTVQGPTPPPDWGLCVVLLNAYPCLGLQYIDTYIHKDSTPLYLPTKSQAEASFRLKSVEEKLDQKQHTLER